LGWELIIRRKIWLLISTGKGGSDKGEDHMVGVEESHHCGGKRKESFETMSSGGFRGDLKESRAYDLTKKKGGEASKRREWPARSRRRWGKASTFITRKRKKKKKNTYPQQAKEKGGGRLGGLVGEKDVSSAKKKRGKAEPAPKSKGKKGDHRVHCAN